MDGFRPMTGIPLSSGALMWRFLVVQRWRIAGAVCAGALTIVSSVCLMAISAYLIERAAQRPPILSLEVAIVSVRFFGISRGVFRYIDRVLSHDASLRLLGEIRADIYRMLVPLAPAGLQDVGSGELFTRIAADVDTLQEWFVRGVVPLCASVVAAALVTVATAFILPAASAALCAALLVAAALALAAVRSRGAGQYREAELRGTVTSGIVEYVQGLSDLIALGAATTVASHVEECDRERARVWTRRATHNALAAGIQAALPGTVAVLLAGIGIASLQRGLNPLTLGVLCLGGMAAAECVTAVPAAADSWSRGRAAAQRLAAISALPVPVTATGSAHPATPANRLRVSGVSFRYADSSPPVLESVSLDLSVGERVLIVGHSGAGKTTLADLLLRFLSPHSGSVALDANDLAGLDEKAVRRNIGATTQDVHLFAGTIRDNILLARPDAAADDLRTAAESAGLADWIDCLPARWDTDVGELGRAVSGGQQRRIALARAILADFPFLIADEPTEGLDTPTAREVMNALFSAAARRGLIVITHCPDLCPRADRAYRLAGARLTPVNPGEA
jgi:thiol reductant ABC exporter CydC subunit